MVRTGLSAADARLVQHLATKGLSVSSAQLERWRSAGVLPKNKRLALGRGRGSISELDDDSLILAEAMAMTVRRGRSIYESVLRLFTCDPEVYDLLDDYTSARLPEEALRAAFEWFIRKGDRTLDRRIERLIHRFPNDLDAAADAVVRMTLRHLQLLRRHGSDLADYRPPIFKLGDNDEDLDHAALAVRRHLGPEEVGSERLAEAISRGLKRLAPRGEEFDVDGFSERLKSRLRDAEMRGISGAYETHDRHMESDEVLRRLAARDISEFHETRGKTAFVAERGELFMRGHLRGVLDADKVLDAIAGSFESNFLFHMIEPIARSLETDAWHRMSAVVVMLLTDDPSYRDTLNVMADAFRPAQISPHPRDPGRPFT